MPIKPCSKDGKSGFKYGDSGACYTGPGAKKKAIKQGLAEQYNGGEKFTGSEIEDYLFAGLIDYEDLNELKLDYPDAVNAYISQKARDKVSEGDFAGPHRSFPIRNQQDVHNAARLIGHADNPEAVKRKIIQIAKRKGLSIPDAWK